MPATVVFAWAVPVNAERQVLGAPAHKIMSAITMSDLWRAAQQPLDLSDPGEACRKHRSERPAWAEDRAASVLESVPPRHLH